MNKKYKEDIEKNYKSIYNIVDDEVINNYEKSCKDLVDKINNLYFDGEADIDWVSNDIGGVATISGCFLDIDFMLTALKYNATKKQFFDYYDLVIEKEGKQDVNFKNYILYNKGFNQQTI